MNPRPEQTQRIPYVRSAALAEDLITGAPVRSPLLSEPNDLTVKRFNPKVPAIMFDHSDQVYVPHREGKMFRFPLREGREKTWDTPGVGTVADLCAGDTLSFLNSTTTVHAVSRRPGEDFARVSIVDPNNRRRSVAYCDLDAPLRNDVLLNGTRNAWQVGLETAEHYRNKITGLAVHLLVHPLGRGYWHSAAPNVVGATPTPKNAAGWDNLEFTGTFWTLRHPSDPRKRPKSW